MEAKGLERKKLDFIQDKQSIRVNHQVKPFKVTSQIFYQGTHQ